MGISDAVEISGRVVDLVKKGVTIGLQEEVMALRVAILDAKDEVLKLREELQVLKGKQKSEGEWAARASKYELVKTSGGAMVYQFKERPEHFACPACFENQRVSVLQDRKVMGGYFDCPNASCKTSYRVADERTPRMRYSPEG